MYEAQIAYIGHKLGSHVLNTFWRKWALAENCFKFLTVQNFEECLSIQP